MTFICANWYLLYTKPLCERKVADRLSEKNIDFYLPMISDTRVRNGRERLVAAPLFPSYIFVRLTDAATYFTALDTKGVVDFVKFGRQIARVNETVISNVRTLVDKGEEVEVCNDVFASSEVLLIREGPLSGLRCEVVKHHGRKKILVRIQILNRVVMTNMPVSSLAKI